MVQESEIMISKRTVQRRLAEEGLTGHRPTKKPRLTEAMKTNILPEHVNTAIRLLRTGVRSECINIDIFLSSKHLNP